MLVIHENRGLTEHIRTIAGRLAASGYSALALDLLSEEGGTGAFPGEAEIAAALAQIPPERFVADMKASLTELKRRVGGKRLAAVGFCFGGAMVWRLLTSNEPRLSAAAPFYGPFPEGGKLRRVSCGGARGLRRTRLAGQRDPAGGQSGTRRGPAEVRTRHLRPRPTTRSSTTPVRGSTRTPPRRSGAGR